MPSFSLDDLEWDNVCPCRRGRSMRFLEDANDDEETVLWQVIYTAVVLILMFAVLLMDKLGPDSVMIVALTAFMASGIISINEGLAGFSNEGLLTVLTLFIVAEGISKTGALDWYMGKLLGRPSNPASAQARLMLPVAFLSAFLNNTPIVAVMIPIVQKWARNCKISVQQLLIPLSFATILGGTCSLIGTSTNLVVVGLLNERYPNDPEMEIGLFSLGLYGVPIALAGIGYLLVASPWLLPGGSRRHRDGDAEIPTESQEGILMGARLAPWSPAAGRSVKRSGLRDTGGIFLVSVHRAATGNVHRAVGQDFVLQVGDVLYFTGLVEGFGDFCEEHGLEILTNEMEQDMRPALSNATFGTVPEGELSPRALLAATDGDLKVGDAEEGIPVEVGVTKESLMNADETERSQAVTRMIDLIRGMDRDEPVGDEERALSLPSSPQKRSHTAPQKVVVTSENELVVVGIEASDRPGLLSDISKAISSLRLNIRHSEACVVGARSISVWRCEMVEAESIPDLEKIWSVVNALLESNTGIQAVKARGLRVLRAIVTKKSSLVGNSPSEVNFRELYRAAIVAVQKGGANVPLANVVFGPGDVLVLQVSEDSPLLKVPPSDFYKHLASPKDASTSTSGGVFSIVNRLSAAVRNLSTDNLPVMDAATSEEQGEIELSLAAADSKDETKQQIAEETTEFSTNQEAAWRDLQVMFVNQDSDAAKETATREFLAAMQIKPKSQLSKRTVAEVGLDKLPGVFLVGIDRPVPPASREDRAKPIALFSGASDKDEIDARSERTSKFPTEQAFNAIPTDTPLQDGDVLWFAGSALAVGDLRKIPGLVSYESDEVEKMNEKVHDRRLVEAVVARRGPLVGKTVKEARFRTRFGAAVIAVHRDGKRIHDHPGKIKLQAGDVLLLEAGPTFIKKSVDQDRSFALVAEVKDSAPPRIRLLIPALVITIAMLAVYTAGVASLLICALVASFLMVAVGLLSEQEVRDAINWEIYLAIASAFGIGTAMVNSGVAGGIAGFLVDIGDGIGIGDAGLLGAVYLATFLISNVVTNNAAAALLFPIALDAAEQTGVDRVIMSYCVMFGASASFMTPFGYQTNLMIYGPGGYKTKDFVMIGGPMQLVLWVLSVFCLAVLNSTNWWVFWLASTVLLVVIICGRNINPRMWCPKEPKNKD